MVKTVEDYFASGCGRCPRFDTPACKVNTWRPILEKLRAIVLDTGLDEVSKWGCPVYTYQKANLVSVTAFNDYAVLSFFKGALLQDEQKLLTAHGEQSQSVRTFRFTDVQEVIRLTDTIKAYIFEAIELEKAGAKVTYKKIEEFEVPTEFHARLDANPQLRTAFEALTPGRRRGYLLHFSQPKQSKTRESRIDKCIPMILAGKGFLD